MGYKITDANGNRVSAQEGGDLLNIETLTADTTLTVEDSGKTYLLDATGEAITLPTAAAGLNYKFRLIADTAVSDWDINSTAANIQGYVSVNYATIAAENETTIAFVATKAIAGDEVELICDGTNWYVSGKGSATGSIVAEVNP